MEGKLYGKIIYQSPRRYVQGKGVIESIAEVNEQLKMVRKDLEDKEV